MNNISINRMTILKILMVKNIFSIIFKKTDIVWKIKINYLIKENFRTITRILKDFNTTLTIILNNDIVKNVIKSPKNIEHKKTLRIP